jgi:hypothetical protein
MMPCRKAFSNAFVTLLMVHSGDDDKTVEVGCRNVTLSAQSVGTLLDKTLGDDQAEPRLGCQSEARRVRCHSATAPAGNNTHSVWMTQASLLPSEQSLN